MCSQTTCEDTSSAISSQESEDGRSRSSSQDGQLIGQCGQGVALVSRLALRASKVGSTILATCGHNSDASSPSNILQSCLESSLRQRLIGSPSCEVIWKNWATPWGQYLWRPRARERTIFGTVIGLWPTATTPSGGQTIPTGTTLTGRKPDGSKTQVTLQNVVLSLWSTLRASDGEKGGPRMSFGAGGSPLPSQVFATGNMSNAPMENGARCLHPEFAGWEMGYPPEWLSCAGSETPSTRARRRK